MPERITQPRLTIVGDRQHGKTHQLIEIAIDAAELGQKVLYQCDLQRETRECFLRAEQCANRRRTVAKVWCARGEQRIKFDSGGVIFFDGRLLRGLGDLYELGEGLDVHILDSSTAEPLPLAGRVYRSALR